MHRHHVEEHVSSGPVANSLFPRQERPGELEANTASKILERLALTRLVPHVTVSPSFDSLQSAYRRRHFTDTALLMVTKDIYDSFNNR